MIRRSTQPTAVKRTPFILSKPIMGFGIMAIVILLIFRFVPNGREPNDTSVMNRNEIEVFDIAVWSSLYPSITLYGNVKTTVSNLLSDRVKSDDTQRYCTESLTYLSNQKTYILSLMEQESRSGAADYGEKTIAFYDGVIAVVNLLYQEADKTSDDRLPMQQWSEIAVCDALLEELRPIRLDFVRQAEFPQHQMTDIENTLNNAINSTR